MAALNEMRFQISTFRPGRPIFVIMEEQKTIEALTEHIKTHFTGESTGHDWHHIARVRNMALHLQKAEGGDRFVIHAAALLHDISDHKFNGGDEHAGGRISLELLRELGVFEEQALKIVAIVDSVSYKGAGVATVPDSIEGKIVQDADRLDALGAIGIARAFAYGGNRGRAIYEPEIAPELHDSFADYKRSQSHTVNHFHEKLLLLKDRMHTKSARKLALKRHLILVDYLEQFLEEWYFTENE